MLLALDTSTLTLSLALLERDAAGKLQVKEAVLEGPPQRQSERLPGVVAELLARHGLTLSKVEALVVGLGPGSFTGLRIGLASMKAFAYAARIPLVGGSSLAAVALEAPAGAKVVATAVARIGDLYVGRYQREGDSVKALSPETAMTPAELAALLVEDTSAVVMGPSLPDYRQALVDGGVAAERILEGGRVPLAENVARVVSGVPTAFDAQAVFALEPHYIRTSGAERNPQFPPLPGPTPTSRMS